MPSVTQRLLSPFLSRPAKRRTLVAISPSPHAQLRNAHKYARPRRNIWARSAREAPSAANMVAVQRPIRTVLRSCHRRLRRRRKPRATPMGRLRNCLPKPSIPADARFHTPMRAALRFPQGVGKSGYLCYLAPMTASGPPSDALLAALYDGIVDAGGSNGRSACWRSSFTARRPRSSHSTRRRPKPTLFPPQACSPSPHCSAPTTKSGRRSILPRAPSRR